MIEIEINSSCAQNTGNITLESGKSSEQTSANARVSLYDLQFEILIEGTISRILN